MFERMREVGVRAGILNTQGAYMKGHYIPAVTQAALRAMRATMVVANPASTVAEIRQKIGMRVKHQIIMVAECRQVTVMKVKNGASMVMGQGAEMAVEVRVPMKIELSHLGDGAPI